MNRFLLIIIATLFSCSPAHMYKNKLVPAGNRAATMGPYGAYIEVTTQNNLLSGEYIAYQHDSLYVLSLEMMHVIPLNEIQYMNLILTRTRTRGYAIGTAIAVSPALLGVLAHPDYSVEFLSLAGITAAAGLMATLIEGAREGQEEHYDGTARNLKKSSKYSRFPKGIPESVNPQHLRSVD